MSHRISFSNSAALQPLTCVGALSLLVACGAGTPAEMPAIDAQPADAATDDTAVDIADDATPTADITGDDAPDVATDTTPEPVTLRVASFNASLYRNNQGSLARMLEEGDDEDAIAVARVVQTMRPDVLLINEFDWDAEGAAAASFVSQYLAVAQADGEAIVYDHWYVPTTNTGEHSGVDLNGDGEAVSEPGSQAYGDDAFGFGRFPGQYGMVVLSRYPIDDAAIRTFQSLRWADMPDNLLPTDWYSETAAEAMRLSSKNHIDVPLLVDGRVVHVLASHPTPPSFDGDEDRNGKRNHDEIRFWTDYLTGGPTAAYIVDDEGAAGGLSDGAHFVVLGDLNSDPFDGDSRHEAIVDLLAHPRTQDPAPSSEGAEESAVDDGGANTSHTGPSNLDTADFSDGQVGNLRVDYAIPSTTVTVDGAGVFWPTADAPDAPLANVSDHHLVWVDIAVP